MVVAFVGEVHGLRELAISSLLPMSTFLLSALQLMLRAGGGGDGGTEGKGGEL